VALPDLSKATLGARLRYLRKRLGVTLEEFSQMTRLGHNTIAKIERGETQKVQPWVLGRILPTLASRFNEAFPETAGDPYDFLIPPTTFGGWLRNFRMRRGLKLKDLARALKVRPFTVIRYEADESKPAPEVRQNLRRTYRLNGELDRFFGHTKADGTL
jgi:transcriptional regulator with XRE-family HTH domain